MNVQSITEELTSGLEPPVSTICERLIEYFATTPFEQQTRMSFMWLADRVNVSWSDSIFQAAIAAMTSIPNHPLNMYFVMYDEVIGREHPIAMSEFKGALDRKFMVHPRTGDELANFQDKLIPVFCLSQEFKSLVSQ